LATRCLQVDGPATQQTLYIVRCGLRTRHSVSVPLHLMARSPPASSSTSIVCWVSRRFSSDSAFRPRLSSGSSRIRVIAHISPGPPDSFATQDYFGTERESLAVVSSVGEEDDCAGVITSWSRRARAPPTAPAKSGLSTLRRRLQRLRVLRKLSQAAPPPVSALVFRASHPIHPRRW
jgi:hypothetical protein